MNFEILTQAEALAKTPAATTWLLSIVNVGQAVTFPAGYGRVLTLEFDNTRPIDHRLASKIVRFIEQADKTGVITDIIVCSPDEGYERCSAIADGLSIWPAGRLGFNWKNKGNPNKYSPSPEVKATFISVFHWASLMLWKADNQ